MTPEQLEFAISQYLDGTLPAAERAALEQRLAEDAEARELLAEYRSLDRLMKDGRELPAVQWEQLTQTISAAVAGHEAIDEEAEFALTQYADSALPLEQMQAVEQRLETDAAARHTLEDYRSLDVMLRRSLALPDVNWNRLTEHLSAAVDEQIERENYSITAWRRIMRQIAVAACLLIVAGSAIWFSKMHGKTSVPGMVQVAEVTVIGPDRSTGTAVAELSLADEPESVARSRLDEYSPGVVALPARVQLAEGVPASYQGLPRLPY
jgi:anti-sigma factor RsiW